MYSILPEFQRITNESIVLTEKVKREKIIEYQSTEDPYILQLLLECHYKLIIKVANDAKREYEKIDVRDLVQNGIIGFMKGIEKCDIDKLGGSKVTSYLFLWVREYINREIKFVFSEVKVPDWQLRVARAVDDTMKLDKIDLTEAINRVSTKTGHPIHKIHNILLNKVTLTPISKPVDINNDNSFENLIFDDSDYQPDEVASDRELKNQLKSLIGGRLTNDEQYVLVHFYGLYNNEKMTLEQIGEELGVTKMAVCHIVKKIVNKLREMEELQ